jgi:HlyD family secretion protein
MKTLRQWAEEGLNRAKNTGSQGKTAVITTSKNAWANHRKKTIAGVVVAVVIILIIAGGSKSGTPVNPHTVGTQNIIDQVVLSGRTESISSVSLGFADSGRVNRVFVTEGQIVKKGQVLAELEMGDLIAQLSSARAELTIARANMNTVNNQQDALVETAKRALYGSLEAYPIDTFSTKSSPTIYGSYNGNEDGEYKLEIYSSSAPTGASVSYSGLESGVTPLTVGNRIALGTKGLYIQFPDANYANMKWVIPVPNNRSSTYAGLKAAYDTAVASRNVATGNAGNNALLLQARVDQANATINQINSAIARRKITAPFSGTISSVDLKEGESTIGISKDTSPGVSMLATDQYKVVIKIPEIDVARVSANTPVSINLDAYGPDVQFAGTLTTINPAETIVDGVPVYEGTVLFTDRDERIRSGMTATVTIKIGEKNGVIAIPGSYIREDKVARKFYVQIVDADNKTSEREIKPGIRGSDGMTEILSGINTGEIVSEIVKK